MHTTVAILLFALVALVGVFVLAALGSISGDQALQFASMAMAAFLGAVAGKSIPSSPAGKLTLRPPGDSKGPRA